jgi:hypothetical protein
VSKLTFLITISFFGMIACASPAEDPDCVSVSATHSTVRATVVVTSCKLAKDEYDVVVDEYKNGETLQQIKFTAEGIAYLPTIDFSLDINADGIPDVGVATGKGRAGDGMHYWLQLATPLRLVDVGEAPQLSTGTTAARILFALVPGGGEIQSTRVDYELRDGLLAPVRAYQFKFQPAGGFQMTSLRPQKSESSSWNAEWSENISEEGAQACMTGGPCLSR